MSESDPVIEVEGLFLIFGSRCDEALEYAKNGKSKQEILEETGCTLAVSDATFKVYQGETFVVMGLSGSGKSTMIRCLNRLIEPTEGTVIIEGEKIMEADEASLKKIRRNKMAMVFQHFGLLPHRTVLSNVAFGLEIIGRDKKEREERAREVIELVGLEGYEDSMTGELSGGMQQRVGLARALAMDPEILLMDEAFGALDPLIRAQMQEELVKIQESMGCTILFITHDLDEALALGDRIAIMNDGAIVQVGTPEDILIHPANDYVKSFVKNVYQGEVITAASIMDEQVNTLSREEASQLTKEEAEDMDQAVVPVLDEEEKLLGYIDLEGQEEFPPSDDSFRKAPKVHPDRHIIDMLNIAWYNELPIGVVDEFDHFKGWVQREEVIRFLTRDEEEE